jgi:hypothetical protein
VLLSCESLSFLVRACGGGGGAGGGGCLMVPRQGAKDGERFESVFWYELKCYLVPQTGIFPQSLSRVAHENLKGCSAI